MEIYNTVRLYNNINQYIFKDINEVVICNFNSSIINIDEESIVKENNNNECIYIKTRK